jgi:putative thioredoxin
LNAGRVDEAQKAYEPVANAVMPDARLVAAGLWLAAIEAAKTARPRDTLDAAIAANKRDFDARY